MGSDTKIEWAHNTFNPWTGCTKVSPGCANCYAEGWAKRSGIVKWGKGEPRRRTSPANWREPIKWNARVAKAGVRERTFCASLADVFDPEAPQEWRDDLFALIRETPWLDWLLLSKRFGLIHQDTIMLMLPDDWGNGYPNVWLGTTVENQAMADKRIPELLRTPSAIRFLSCEPLLGPVNLGRIDATSETDPGFSAMQCGPDDEGPLQTTIDWVICGGESGPSARPMHPDWARSLRDQCAEAGTPFMFKQWGEFKPHVSGDARLLKPWHEFEDGRIVIKVGKHEAGRLLDGIEHNGFPDQK